MSFRQEETLLFAFALEDLTVEGATFGFTFDGYSLLNSDIAFFTVDSFSIHVDSWASGALGKIVYQLTGPNTITMLNETACVSRGYVNVETGEWSAFVYGGLTNRLFSPTNPAPVAIQLAGVLDAEAGTWTLTEGDAMASTPTGFADNLQLR